MSYCDDDFPAFGEGAAQLWRHKPVVKEAIEWAGDNAAAIIEWAGDKAYMELGRLVVRTPQGDMIPAVGDWVVRGIEGEFYPVPRSIFLGSYEFVGGRS
jgi:hypothetical protein